MARPRGRAGRTGAKRDDKRPLPEGHLRQSQLLTTFGPGAMVDLVNRAVVIGGLEHWGFGRAGFQALDDERLRRSLLPRLEALDPHLGLATEGYFRMPPAGDAREPMPDVGVRALEFPRWLVCQGCKRLASARDGFQNKEGKNGRYLHECASNKKAKAVPVRFVAACPGGHLTDYPWLAFVHGEREAACDRPELYLREGATGDFSKIHVECATCDARRPLNDAVNMRYQCGGDRPWLGGPDANERCGRKMELLVRTASHAYFSQVVSALRLPEEAPDPLVALVQRKDLWPIVGQVASLDDLAPLVRLVPAVRSALGDEDPERVVAAIVRVRGGGARVAERPLRTAEFERITAAPLEQSGQVPAEDVLFAAYRVPPRRLDLPAGVSGLIVVPELREVRVQVSFSRFDSPVADLQGEYDLAGGRQRATPATLTLPEGNEKWLPAAEVRGEGIFVELDEAEVVAWERRPEVVERADRLLRACQLDERPFPGPRFYLLHSLAHLLLTAISLECGYSASAIRERIYCMPPGGAEPPMAALMLSTGTTGSEGTLGGLVEEGRRIRHHLREAWELGRLCSNDPVCAAHDPAAQATDRRTEGAACHGCLYVAESSCDHFNRFMDRALVVPTIGNPAELAFFRERP